MGIYARDTMVSVEKSRGEIERILQRYGASAFFYGTQNGRAVVQFEAEHRRIRFELQLPDPRDDQFTKNRYGNEYYADVAQQKWEQACRQQWRALALSIKAKLESVQSGISTFEEEFLSRIVLPGGKTVGQVMSPQIAESYESGKMPPLLGYGGTK